MALCIGVMTGTSVDGVDVALVDFGGARPELRHALAFPMPGDLRGRLQRAIAAQGSLPAREVWALDDAVGHLYADAVQALLKRTETSPEAVLVVGCAGQTVYHAPDARPALTVQLCNANVVAERCSITAVGDLRRRDVAAGGQGAPLACAFHAAYLRDDALERVVLNIGGIANVTLLPAGHDDAVTGFDTGPGNTLLDLWAGRHLGEPMDRDGIWASTGRVDAALLERLMDEPYFRRDTPKSTGRELFNASWLDARLDSLQGPVGPADVQRTLVELTARSIAEAVDRHAHGADQVVVAGGGGRNPLLMAALEARLTPKLVCTSADLGVDPDWMEAIAFAWLAWRTLGRVAGNLPSVTGAAHPVVLGGIYPGGIDEPSRG